MLGFLQANKFCDGVSYYLEAYGPLNKMLTVIVTDNVWPLLYTHWLQDLKGQIIEANEGTVLIP